MPDGPFLPSAPLPTDPVAVTDPLLAEAEPAENDDFVGRDEVGTLSGSEPTSVPAVPVPPLVV
jgi:hypothetical protein